MPYEDKIYGKEYDKKWRQKNRKNLNEYGRERYRRGYDRKKMGICSFCGGKTSRKETHRCRTCMDIQNKRDPEYRRFWAIMKKYNLSREDFEAYWMAVKGKCMICGKQMKQPENRRGQSLDVVAVDHCHKTNKFRGLLCNACNKGLGLFNDNPILLENAIKYLKE